MAKVIWNRWSTLVIAGIFCSLLIRVKATKTTNKFENSSFLQSIYPKNYSQVWIRPLVQQVMEQSQFYGVTILQEYGSWIFRPRLSSLINQEVLEYVPGLQIDSKIFHQTEIKYGITKYGTLTRPKSTLNVILLAENKRFYETYKTFDEVMAPIHRRIGVGSAYPKILLVFFVRKKFSDQYLLFMSHIFRHYRKYFAEVIDLSWIIVSPDRKELPHEFKYAVVSDFLVGGPWNRTKVLFPDKLKNMEGSDFNVCYNSYYDMDRDAEDAEYKFIPRTLAPPTLAFGKNFFCKMHNCSARQTPRSPTCNIEWGIYNVELIPSIDDIVCIAFYDIAIFKAAIPHLSDVNVETSLQFENIIIFFALITIILITVSLLLRKLKRFHWKTLDIFSCMLGSGFSISRDLVERIVYLSLIILSLYISNVLIDIACEYQLEEVKKTVDNWDSIFKMNLSIYDDRPYIKNVLMALGQGSLANRIGSYDSHCLEKLYAANDRVCISNEERIAMSGVFLNKENEGGRSFRIANFEAFRMLTIYSLAVRSFRTCADIH